MNESPEPIELPAPLAEQIKFARDWWHNERARPLPGEEGGHTVFVIEFYDGCKYFGYTKDDVTYRVASLMTDVGGWGTNLFVESHAKRVPYLVRCIRSGMDEGGARQLRSLLLSLAGANRRVGSKSIVETEACWMLLEGDCWESFSYEFP